MNTAPDTRLHLFFATENAKAVVLLRTAKNLYRLISWDRGTDTFADGQWLRKEMYPDACTLSPDGAHFLFTVISQNPENSPYGSYTVVSTPPYFTAHMLFPNAYGFGAIFLSNELVMLRDPRTRDQFGTYDKVQHVMEGDVTKDCKTGLRLPNGQPAPLSRELRQRISGETTAPIQPDPLDRYDTMNGCLHHIESDGSLRLIRDFRDMEFENIKAPYAAPTQPENTDAWHPLDGEHP